MKKKFSKTLSVALAGALAVGSFGMSPITAFAEGEQMTVDAGDIVQFVEGTAGGVLAEAYKGKDIAITLANKNDTIPKNSALFTTLPTAQAIQDPYEFAWVNGSDIILPTDEETGDGTAYSDLHVFAGKATLIGDKVGQVLTVTAKAHGKKVVLNDGSDPATTTTAKSVSDVGEGESAYGTANKVFKIRYDAKTIDSETPAEGRVKASEGLADPTAPTGWTFWGWDTDGVYTTREIAAGASDETKSDAIDASVWKGGVSFATAKDLAELTPLWIEDTYTLVYDDNGATEGAKPQKVEGTYASFGTDKVATLTGVKKGSFVPKADSTWNTKPDGSGSGYLGGTATIKSVFDAAIAAKTFGADKTVTLYVDWNDEYTVAIGGTSGGNVAGITYPTVATTNGTWDGHPNVKAGSKVELPTVKEGIMPGMNQISINNNGAPGYTFEFLGFSTEGAGQDGKMQVTSGCVQGAEVTVNKNTTFYPVFKATEAEVEPVEATTFVLKPGDYAAANSRDKNLKGQIVGTKIKVANPFTAKTNYHFVEWEYPEPTEEVPAATATVKENEDYTVKANNELTAKWEKDTFKFVFYDGTDVISRKTVAFDGKLPSAAADAQVQTIEDLSSRTSTGTLRGWATKPNATVPEYFDGTTADTFFTEKDAIVTLYAVRVSTDDAIEVEYASTLNISALPGATMSVKKGSEITLASFEKDGYELVGWTTDRDYTTEETATKSGATILAIGTKQTISKKAVYYAVWRPVTTITLDDNIEGSTDGDVTVKTSGTTFDFPEYTFNRPGYSFVGWNVVKNTDTAKWTDGAKNVKVSELAAGNTAFAIWKPNSYRFEFVTNSDYVTGTVTGEVWTATTPDATVPITATLKVEKFEDKTPKVRFAGWGLTKDASEDDLFLQGVGLYADVVEIAKAEPNSTITLYGIWTLSPKEEAVLAKAEAEEAKKAQEEAEAAKADADQKAADAKAAADKATADAKTATDKAASDVKAANDAKAASDKAAADAKTAQTTAEQKAADAQKTADSANAKLKLSTALTANAGKTKKVSGTSYKTDADAGKSVAVTKGKNVKTLTIGKTVKIGGNTYKVRALNAKAFTGKKIRTIKIAGNNLKNVDVNAFKNTKATKITITKCKAVKKQLQAAAKAAGLKCTVKGTTATITKK